MFIIHLVQVLDALVRWDGDGSENVVSRSQLKVIRGGRLIINSTVKMWWEVTGSGRGGKVRC